MPGVSACHVHVTRCLAAGHDITDINQDFFARCLCAFANETPRPSVKRPTPPDERAVLRHDPDLLHTLKDMRQLTPHSSGAGSHRVTGQLHMLISAARQVNTNFRVSISTTLRARLAKWLRMQMSRRAMEQSDIQDVHAAIAMHYGNKFKSVLSVLSRACAHLPNSDVWLFPSIDEMIPQYPRLRDGALAEEELRWMCLACFTMQRHIKSRVSVTPDQLKKRPGKWISLLFDVLQDLERFNEDLDPARGEHQLRHFTLLSQRCLCAHYVRIHTHTFAELHVALKMLAKTKGDADRVAELETADAAVASDGKSSLWLFYFDIEGSCRRGIRYPVATFAHLVDTNGVSASVIYTKSKKCGMGSGK